MELMLKAILHFYSSAQEKSTIIEYRKNQTRQLYKLLDCDSYLALLITPCKNEQQTTDNDHRTFYLSK